MHIQKFRAAFTRKSEKKNTFPFVLIVIMTLFVVFPTRSDETKYRTVHLVTDVIRAGNNTMEVKKPRIFVSF